MQGIRYSHPGKHPQRRGQHAVVNGHVLFSLQRRLDIVADEGFAKLFSRWRRPSPGATTCCTLSSPICRVFAIRIRIAQDIVADEGFANN
jgi:hypothetical protein